MVPKVSLADGPVLLDGGMGQELYSRAKGDVGNLWSGQVLIDQPELVQEVHEEFIQAGAEIITTNTYMLGRRKLEKACLGYEFEALNVRAGQLACKAREKTNTNVKIAGALPPLSGSFRPDLVAPINLIEPLYSEQAEILAPYVDFFLCETMSSAEEALAAVAGAAKFGKPIWVSWTLQDNGSKTLRSGESLTEAHAALNGQPVSAFLVNCCSPESVSAAIPELVSISDCPVGGLANGFAEVPTDWVSSDKIEALGRREDLNEINYAFHVKNWIASGARLVGGCCEIGPNHIAHVRQMLDEQRLSIKSHDTIHSV